MVQSQPVPRRPSATLPPSPVVTDIRRRPRVRERTRRRVLDAARVLVASSGLDALSMRTLADEAGVSATTLYNLFGTKEGVVHAVATDILGEIDSAFEHVVHDDPVEQLRARILLLVDLVIEQAPPSLVSAVLENAVLTEQINAQWESRSLVEDAIREAIARRQLHDDLEPGVVAEHVRASLLHQQRLWAAGVIDATTYRSSAAYSLDYALYAISRGATRARLLRYLKAEQETLAAKAPSDPNA
jgi:AcrR family transcriptional regulator